MDEGALHERLRRARSARGEELSALSRRTGIRVQHLRAIEEGRFGELPPGIFARAAVRSFAKAYQFDPAPILAECDALLPKIDDPIGALARKCGVSHAPDATPRVPVPTDGDPHAQWRTLTGAAIDAVLIALLLIVVAVSAALLGRVPIAALGASPAPLALVGMVLGMAYFVWFGGLCGRTLGGLALQMPAHASDRAPLILRTIATRAILAATDDTRAIVRLGAQLWRWRLRPDAPSRTAPPPALEPWPLRLRGRAPVLWSPANRPAGAPTPPLPQPRG
jgi:Helix-turn-helix domain